MVLSEDKTSPFLPKKKPRMVILGTMVAICARTLNGKEPVEETFYYHNPRNHFWRVLQCLFKPDLDYKKLSLEDKKSFLDEHRIAIINLVKKIEVPNSEAHDPSDTVLFKAQKKGRIGFRKLHPEVKKMVQKTPLFFTCRSKKGIDGLLTGFFEVNHLSHEIYNNILFLPTPTRCNPRDRADMWRQEICDARGPQFFKGK